MDGGGNPRYLSPMPCPATPAPDPIPPAPRPSLAAVAVSFLRIGAMAFGGGIAALPVFEAELARTRRWMPSDDVAECFAIAQSVPGIIIVNFAVLAGRQLRGVPGALAAAFAVVAPAFLLVLLFSSVLAGRWDAPWLQAVLSGLRPAVVALLLAAAWRIARTRIAGPAAVVLFLAAGALHLACGVPLPLLLLLAAAAGIVLGRLAPARRKERAP